MRRTGIGLGAAGLTLGALLCGAMAVPVANADSRSAEPIISILSLPGSGMASYSFPVMADPG